MNQQLPVIVIEKIARKFNFDLKLKKRISNPSSPDPDRLFERNSCNFLHLSNLLSMLFGSRSLRIEPVFLYLSPWLASKVFRHYHLDWFYIGFLDTLESCLYNKPIYQSLAILCPQNGC
jgi:hypothetical protein